ncbi:MAG TPA: hypothetical protein VKV19_18375 [Ktedonobacteraceae bacterium]|nr:hypothetical protein [Ktedonobacteraceae bacterium]
MKTQRWLLPFTCSVHMRAIDAALRVANFNGATLVALSLVAPRPGRGMLHIRLEQIQESRDFLEAVRWKAIRSQTAVELHEVLTNDVPGSIATSVQELACQSIMLINCEARGKRGLQYTLLSEEALKQVLMEPPASLLFLTLPAASGHPHLRSLLFGRLRFRRPPGQPKEVQREQDAMSETAVAPAHRVEERQHV